MSYAKVLFIGYTLHTAPKSAVFQGDQLELASGPYPGLSHPGQDLRARCALVKSALHAAHTALDKQALNDRELLKLFVLPEFFFHGQGAAYDLDSAESGIDRLQAELARLLKARKWQDWLCVFGSALFFRRDPSGPLVYNCGLVHQGGPDAEPPVAVHLPLAEAETLIPPKLPVAKGEPHWADEDRPDWDQTGHVHLANVSLALELATNHRSRTLRSHLADPLPGFPAPQLTIRPLCVPLREPWSELQPSALAFLCNGLAQGECQLHDGDQLLRPQKTLPLDASDHDIPALFAGRSAGRISLFAPRPLPPLVLAETFTARFSHVTRTGHVLDFSFPYNREGRLQQVEVHARLADGAASTTAQLPCTLELKHPHHPLVARLALRYAPTDPHGRDLLIFADIDGDAKGSLHSFASRIPTGTAPGPDTRHAEAAPSATAPPTTDRPDPEKREPVANKPAPATSSVAPPLAPQPVGQAALTAARSKAKVAHKTKEKIMSDIIEIEGIGPAIAGILANHAITTVEDLLKRAADPKSRKELAQASGLPYKLILRWCNMADLFRIKGVAEEYSDLLEAAGVDTVPELAQRNGEHLHQRMSEVNERRKLVRRMPTAKQVAEWVEQAKNLPRLMTY